MSDYGTKWIKWEGKSPWPDGYNYLRIGRDGEIHATCASPDPDGWVKNPGFNVWPDDAVVEVEWDDAPEQRPAESSSFDFHIGNNEPNITRSRLANQDTTTTEEDEAWAEAEARMNVIGQNGNDGNHYARKRAAELWPIVKHFAEGGDVGTFDAGYIYKQDDPNWNDRRLQIIKKTRTTWLWVKEYGNGKVVHERAEKMPWDTLHPHPHSCVVFCGKVPGTERVEEVE